MRYYSLILNTDAEEIKESAKINLREYGYNIASGGKDGAGLPGGKNHNARAVECIETGEKWECANYCAKDLNVPSTMW